MSRKTVNYNRSGASKLPEDSPVVYRIKTDRGRTNYIGSSKKGRVQERISEHLDAGKVPGAKVEIEQMASIEEARKIEARAIARTKPKYNKKGGG